MLKPSTGRLLPQVLLWELIFSELFYNFDCASLVVVFIVIMNTLIISVIERTSEIGTMRAPVHIADLFEN